VAGYPGESPSKYADDSVMENGSASGDPQERMEMIQADMRSEASAKENSARDLEDRVLQLRAEAAGLRAGAEGLEAAIEVYNRERARAQEFRQGRDEREGSDKPMRVKRG
jgi:hypothetical protein